MKNIRILPLVLPFSILFVGIISLLLNEQATQAAVLDANNWVISKFDWLLSITSVLMVATCAIAYFSSLGHVRIGGEAAKPMLSKFNWFSITLCSTIAAGMLFWSTAEPIYHLYGPPESLGIIPNTDAARTFAFSTLFLHWSFIPYAIYTVPALTFALAYHNLKKDHSVGGLLSPLFGRYTKGMWGQLIDAMALFSLVAGMSSALGQGLLTLAGGINKFTGIETSPMLLAIIATVVVATVVASAVSGLLKGILFLSSLNVVFFIALAVFVIIYGPTGYSVSAGVDGMGDYLTNFFNKSLFTGEIYGDDWPKWWTNFYWAQWLAWAPIIALFLGYISRGYTVREFILTVMVFPALFTIGWMTIFGGMSLQIDAATGGAVKATLDANGVESVIYYILEQLPFSRFIIISFVIITFISFVTAADSSTEAMAAVCLNKENKTDTGNQGPSDSTKLWLKVMMVSTIGFITWSMVSFSGIQGVKILANLGMLPGLIIGIGAMATLWYLIALHTNATRPVTTGIFNLDDDGEPQLKATAGTTYSVNQWQPSSAMANAHSSIDLDSALSATTLTAPKRATS